MFVSQVYSVWFCVRLTLYPRYLANGKVGISIFRVGTGCGVYVAWRPPGRPGDVPRATRPSGGVRGTICTPLHDHAAILVTVQTLHFWTQKRGKGSDWPSALVWSRTDATDMYTRIQTTTGLPGTVYTRGMGWEARWQP